MPRPSAHEPPAWISVARTARILGVGERGVLKLIGAGRLTTRTLPENWIRIRRDEVEALASRHTHPSTSK
jgi:hypothetical protein